MPSESTSDPAGAGGLDRSALGGFGALIATQQAGSYERSTIGEATCAWLLHLAVADPKQPPPTMIPDWQELFREICRNYLVGIARQVLASGPTVQAVPADLLEWVREAHRATALHMMVVSEMVEEVLARFDAAGIEWLLLKGPALAHGVYPDPTLRAYNDLDLVIHERDWEGAYRALGDLGYRPVRPLPSPPPRLVPSAALYHAPYRHPRSDMLVEVHVDDLLHTGLGVRDLPGIWERSVTVPGSKRPLRTLGYDDQLVTLAIHAHYHGLERLNWLSDLVFLLREHGKRLDLDRIVAFARREEVQVGVFYGLWYTEQLTGLGPPDGVLAALRPDPIRRRLHELWMPDVQVLSLQPMRRPMFSFYPTPLYGRLLPDLLVMGRLADKFHYLARMVVPPKEWLLDYYQLDPSRWTWLQRLAHQFRLVYRLSAEILTPARFRLRDRADEEA